jgi:hypothetical protein
MKLEPVTYTLDVNAVNELLGIDRLVPATSPDGFTRASTMVRTGFIAQDVEAAARALGYDFSGVDAPKNESDLYGLRYAEFVVPLVKAVQEQQALIQLLQQTVGEQSARIAVLEARLGQ